MISLDRDVLVVFPTWNRLDYNMITLPALVYECEQSPVFGRLLIIDDLSEDGTTQYIKKMLPQIKKVLGAERVQYMRRSIGGSTMQWNIAKNKCKGTELKYIANFTNENVIPYGALEKLRSHFKEDVFAVGPALSGNAQRRNGVITGFPFITDEPDMVKVATHIGCGLVRVDLLEEFGDVPVKTGTRKLFGFTEYQNKLKRAGYKILRDDSVRFLRLDESPIYSQSIRYHKEGYSRLLNSNAKAILNK